MAKSDKVKSVFTQKSLPPLFGENFTKGNLNWKQLNNIEFERIGRILICHLLIETHINKLLEIRLPKGLDIDEANLNFIQKLKMIRNDHIFKKINFFQGIIIVNKIRNKFSHDINAVIEASEIG